MAALSGSPVSASSGLPARAADFWTGLKSEFKKIIWPTPMQIIGQTVVVVVVVTAMTLLLWALDSGWRLVIGLISPHRLMGG